MASSGTATFTLTRDQLISSSLRLIRVLQDGQSAGSNDLTDCSQALNILLKYLQTKGLILSTYDQYQLPLTTSTQSYTIGPSGAALTKPRPLRIVDGTFVRKGTTDTPVELITRQRYMQQVDKATAGTVSMIYYEPNIDTTSVGITSMGTGFGTLFVMAPAVDNTYTLYLNVQRPVQDVTSGTDEIDLPVEWLMALKWGLAAQVADEYEVPEDRIIRVQKMAMMYAQDLEAWNKTQGSIAFGDDRIRMERARDEPTTQE